MITEIITKHRDFSFGFTIGFGSALLMIVLLFLYSELLAWFIVRKSKQKTVQLSSTETLSQGGPNSQSWRR